MPFGLVNLAFNSELASAAIAFCIQFCFKTGFRARLAVLEDSPAAFRLANFTLQNKNSDAGLCILPTNDGDAKTVADCLPIGVIAPWLTISGLQRSRQKSPQGVRHLEYRYLG